MTVSPRRLILAVGVCGISLIVLLAVVWTMGVRHGVSLASEKAAKGNKRSAVTTPNDRLGDVQISLMWDNRNDLDLHCIEPSGNHIYHGARKSKSGGELDVEMNSKPPYSEKPVENIYWPPGGAPIGRYAILVHYYQQHDNAGPTPFTVGLKANGQVLEFKGTAIPGEPAQTIHTFEVLPPLQ